MGRARELANLFSGGSADINVKTSDGGILNLQTSDTTVTQDSVVGSIQFQAPDEASGTDAILVASKIEAIAEGTFSASSNATSLVFSTASSAAAGTVAGKMTFTSGGELVIKDTDTADGSSPTITLQTGDTDIAQDDVLGSINFQAPDEGTGTDAILVAAGIAAVSEGDFSSSSNATKLVFKTGSSEAAAEKMSLSSAGILTVADDIIIGDGKTIGSSSDPDAIAIGSDGDVTLTQDLELQHDGATISFGANDDIQLIHVHNEGVTLKAVDTGGNSGLGPVLNLSTGDTDIAAGNNLGTINFQAPDEGNGTDAILVGASITAIAQDAFSSSVNSTSLLMRTSTSGTNDGGYLELTPTGNVNIRNQNSADDSFPTLTLQTGDTDIAQNDVLGRISFQAPNEGAGTDAVLAGAGIQAVSEGDFSASSNATSLVLMTGSTAAAEERFRINSDGNVGVRVVPYGWTSSWRGIDIGDQQHIGEIDGGSSYVVKNAYYDGSNWKYKESSVAPSFINMDTAGFIYLQNASTGSADANVTVTSGALMNADNFWKVRGGYGYLDSSGTWHEMNTNKQSTSGLVVIANNPSRDGIGVVVYHTVSHSNTNAKHFAAYSNYPGGTADLEFYVRNDGQIYADGNFNSGGADYAEFFEWKDGNSSSEDRVGYSVVLEDNKIRKATDSDSASNIIGVISGNPSVVGDSDGETWNGQYLKDDFNRYTYKDSEMYTWTETKSVGSNQESQEIVYFKDDLPSDVTVPKDAVTTQCKVRILNPDYDASKKDSYETRESRKEWSYVGMMGKLRMRKGQPTGDRWIKMKDISDTIEEWLVR